MHTSLPQPCYTIYVVKLVAVLIQDDVITLISACVFFVLFCFFFFFQSFCSLVECRIVLPSMLQVHSSPGNEGIIYALSWSPGKFPLHFESFITLMNQNNKCRRFLLNFVSYASLYQVLYVFNYSQTFIVCTLIIFTFQ